MSIVDFFKKVGHGIASVAEWPFKHAAQLAHILHVTDSEIKVVQQLAPATREALVELVVKIEKLGPDVIAAVASKGLDIPNDLKTVADLKDVFAFIKDTLFPTIESDYKAIVDAAESNTTADPAPAAPALASDGTEAADLAAPGLHNVVPA